MADFVIKGRNINKVTSRTEHWTFDLNALASGMQGRKLRFRGRPKLTNRIISAFESLYGSGSRRSAYRSKANLYYFWQFLDDIEETSRLIGTVAPAYINDLDWLELQAVWREFINWLKAKPMQELSNRTKYYINHTVYSVFIEAHKLEVQAGQTDIEYLDIYIHLRDKLKSSYAEDHLDYDEAKRAFGCLATQWRAAVYRVDLGRDLAAQGRNPATGSSGAHRWNGGLWREENNRLWIVYNKLPFGKLCPNDLPLTRLRDGFCGYKLSDELKPDYPTATGLWAHVPALFFTWREIAIAFQMVCLKTGMNSDSIAAMRVDSWHRPDPLHPGKRVILYGPKRIQGKVQRASSSVNRKTDAYQIILKVIEITEPLRRRAREVAAETGDQRLSQIADLIWIWPSTRIGLGNFLPGFWAVSIYSFMDDLFARAGVKRNNGEPFRLRLSMGRDVWGLFVYHKSGFSHLLTAQALGHSTLRSLLHYIEKRALKISDRKRLIDLQGTVLNDLKFGRFDPPSYRVAVRASTGLNCTDISHPSSEADPGNPGGLICRRQNCSVCHNWYATIESLPYLIRIVSDLLAIREQTTVALWESSDYPVMLAIYKHIIDKFHSSHIEKAQGPASRLAPIVPTTRFTPSARAFVG